MDWATSGSVVDAQPETQKLRLICAVRQPLIAPGFLGGGMQRNHGENHVTLKWKRGGEPQKHGLA